MTSIPHIDLAAYSYVLPDDRIALQPAGRRDACRLLACSVPRGQITHHTFPDLVSLIPSGALLIANDTRVVRARLVLEKPTGGQVEFFLLDPAGPVADPAVALSATAASHWQCLVGGARKLREGVATGVFGDVHLTAQVTGRVGEGYSVQFRWTPQALTFADVLLQAGRVPLPPYIKRQAVPDDAERYQTVYASHDGAVAAPTAGLHFTPEIFAGLQAKGVQVQNVTLHVGAGTFRPVKGLLQQHRMHSERLHVSLPALHRMIVQAGRRAAGEPAPLVLVGTTTVRTVESLYWFGVRLLNRDGDAHSGSGLFVGQWDPYRLADMQGTALPDPVAALQAVADWAEGLGMAEVTGSTQILIVPGYTFRLCDTLITNFHQPESTLMLLVGAFLGRDLLHEVYRQALDTGYRFLSYGDASLLTLREL